MADHQSYRSRLADLLNSSRHEQKTLIEGIIVDLESTISELDSLGLMLPANHLALAVEMLREQLIAAQTNPIAN